MSSRCAARRRGVAERIASAGLRERGRITSARQAPDPVGVGPRPDTSYPHVLCVSDHAEYLSLYQPFLMSIVVIAYFRA